MNNTMQQFISQPTGSGAAAAAHLDAVCNNRLAAVCAATRHGHLALLGPGSELIRLALAAGAAGGSLPPESVYDWTLATAAHAAAAAMERQQQQAWAALMAAAAAGANRRPGEAGSSVAKQGVDDHDNPSRNDHSATAADLAAGSDGSSSAGPKINIKGFMNKIGDGLEKAGKGVAGGFVKAFDETQKGLQKVAQVRCIIMCICPTVRTIFVC